jgi:hypothetical protein
MQAHNDCVTNQAKRLDHWHITHECVRVCVCVLGTEPGLTHAKHTLPLSDTPSWCVSFFTGVRTREAFAGEAMSQEFPSVL